MKRLVLFVVAAIIGIATANAQITQGRIGTGSITIAGSTTSDVYGLDFDNDGSDLEFRIADFPGSPSVTGGYLTYNWTDGGNNIVNEDGVWDYVAILDAGVTIGSSSEFEGQGDGSFNSSSITAGTHYMGFRISLDDGVHYGWAEYTVSENGSDYDIVWNKCFYNATVGASIETGDEGGSVPTPTLGTFVVADGSATNGMVPIYGYYADAYLRCQTIYPESMLTGIVGNDIYGITYYLTSPATGSWGNASFEVKIGTVGNSSFESAEWADVTSFTTVYTGALDGTASELTINFTSPWTYTGGNLLIEVNNTVKGTYKTVTFAGMESENASLQNYSSTSLEAITATQRNFIPKTGFMVPVSCAQPSDLAVVAGETTASISWTENGSATQWQYKLDDGDWVTIGENPYTIPGLTASTEYSIDLRAYCTEDDQSLAVSTTFSTTCAIESIPFTEDFEGISAGLPNCWEQEASNLTSAKWDFSSEGNTGNGLVFSDWYGYQSRLVPPAIDCSSLTGGAQLSFSYKNPANTNSKSVSLALYYRTSPTDEWVAIDDFNVTTANDSWTDVDVMLPNSAAAAYYQISLLAIGENTSPRVYAYIDDISVDAPPACVRPSGFSAQPADVSVVLSWTENGSATKWLVKIDGDDDYRLATTNPLTIEGLTPSTDYTAELRSFCDPDTSGSVYVSFRTVCSAEPIPYEVDFDDMTTYETPDCWTAIATYSNYSGNNPMVSTTAGLTDNGLYFYASSSSPNLIATPMFDREVNTCVVSFDAKLANYSVVKLIVGAMENPSDASTFIPLDTIVGNVNANTWTSYDFDFSTYAAIASSDARYVAIRFEGSYDYGYIDNFSVKKASNCKKVTGLTLVEATTSSITIGWTIDENIGSPSTSVLVSYKADDASDWVEAQATGNSFTLSNIGEGETYNFMVTNVCGDEMADYASLTASSKVCGEVADGSTTINSIPTYVYYSYSYSQAIYTAAEVGDIDTIRGISYNYNGSGSTTRTVDVYMYEAENASLDDGCIDISLFTQVASNYEWEVSNGWSEIVFEVPFVHHSGNDIVVAVDDNTGNYASNTAFIGHAGSGYSYYQDGGDIDPENPSASSSGARTAVADIRFTAVCPVPEEPEICETPSGLAVSDITANAAVVSWTNVELPEADENFDGNWALAMAGNASVHRTLTLDASLHSILSAMGQDIDDTDEDASVAGSEVTVAIAPAGGDQVNVVGSFSLEVTSGVALPFNFSTSGTLTASGLNIEPADLSQSTTLYDVMPVNFTGTLTFAQPTALPENGILTLVMESLDINGNGTMDLGYVSGSATMSISGSAIAASGSREASSVSYPAYELLLTNSATGVETTIVTTDNPYNMTNLTPTTDYTVSIRTLCSESNYSDWSDEVAFATLDEEPVVCDVPTALAVSDVTATTATVSWSGTAAQYEVVVKNIATAAEITNTVAASPYTATGLTAETSYEVKVRAICDDNVTSDWTSSVGFVTTQAGGNEPTECNTPVNVTVSDITSSSASVMWSGVESGDNDGFVGNWDLVLSENDEMHMTVVFDQMLHMLLAMQGSDIDDIDTTSSVAGMPVPLTIEQGEGDQLNVSGSFDLEVDEGFDPIRLHFSTTATQTANGMTVEPATIDEMVDMMDEMTFHFTGTMTFAQPTALPQDGILTLEIASLDIAGVSSIEVAAGVSANVNVGIDATQLHAVGQKTAAGVQAYEVVVTNTANGDEIIVSTSYSHFYFEDLLPATDYTVSVRALCGENNYSDWSAPVPFTTLNDDVNPTDCDIPANLTVSNVDATSATIAWTGTASQYEVSITGGEQPVTQTVSANTYDVQGLTAATAYTVRVRAICGDGLTSDWSTAADFTTLSNGIDDVSAAYSVSIYPNPARSEVMLHIDGFGGNASVSVIDMSGRVVMNDAMSSESVKLDVSSLARGTYFVRISGESISTVRKLVIQ